MKPIKAVIIEDEYPAARLLNHMLNEIRPDWDIEILPGTIEEATEWFSTHPHPDLAFLDIHLTDGNSFSFIEQAVPQSMIIFTTAYDEYAIQAFSVNSIDYLLKPIHKERLISAVEKFERLFQNAPQPFQEQDRLLRALEALTEQNKKYRTRFLISSNNRMLSLPVSEIAYFRSQDKTTYAITHSGKQHILDQPLSKLEEELDKDHFFRINRQYIVSVDSIRRIEPFFLNKMRIHLLPETDEAVFISRERVNALKQWLDY